MNLIEISHIKGIISKMKINGKLGKILVMNRPWYKWAKDKNCQF